MRIYLTIFLFLCYFSNGKSAKLDSLILKYENASNDSLKANALIGIIELTYDSDTTKCLNYIKTLEELAESKNSDYLFGQASQVKGVYLKKRGRIPEAIKCFTESSNRYKNSNDQKRLAIVYGNLGACYADKGDYIEAGQVLMSALRIYDNLKEDAYKGKALLNLGLVFYYQKNYDLALNYYYQSLKIKQKLNDSLGIALVYNNIGIINHFKKDDKTALLNFKKVLSIYSRHGSKRNLSMPLFNIAEIYNEMNEADSAILYYKQSYAIDSSLNDKASCAKSLIQLANFSNAQKKYSLAEFYAKQALEFSKETDSKEDIKDSYIALSRIYANTKEFEKAFEYADLAGSLKDTLYDSQSSEMVAELQTRYETEKKDLQLEQQSETIRNQRTISIILTLGIIIALLLLGSIYWQYRLKKQAYTILEIQKKQITDSINYASRIQAALLPPEELLRHVLPEHFVLYMPKDIVSGDFYWISISGNKTFIAVADCTGHGVPGAFMSMLGFAFLNEIVNRNPESNAHEVLNALRDKVKGSLNQNNSALTRDGMDIALVVVDFTTHQLQYAGANNPLIICRKGEIINLLPDRMPIGVHIQEAESFTLKNIELEKDDVFYMFSDGYVDQFGGDSIKKLGRQNFNMLLLEASSLPLKEQKILFAERIKEWMVSMEQMDDMLIMGVKI